ncbi:MAG: hypothetical protein ACM3Z4_02465 [Hyphomicrobiales bacterium]
MATSQALTTEDWQTFYDQAKAALQGRAYLILVDASGRQRLNTYVPYGELFAACRRSRHQLFPISSRAWWSRNPCSTSQYLFCEMANFASS